MSHRLAPVLTLLFPLLGVSVACTSILGIDPPKESQGPDSGAAANAEAGADACPPLGAAASDVYVAQTTNPLGANGTSTCPFARIGEGLAAAARSSAAAKVVHVSVGKFANEAFPLIVKGGVSLVGTGLHDSDPTKSTIVSGTGAYAYPGETPVQATIVVGDTAGASTIENIAVESGGSAAARTGILCDRGSSAGGEPDLFLKSVDVSGYVSAAEPPGTSVRMIAHTGSNGCSAHVLSSRFHDSFRGIDAAGCTLYGVGGRLSIELGDGTPNGGNDFYALGVASANTGWGARISDCVTSAKISGNTFRDSPGGLEISQDDQTVAPRGNIEIDDNHFLGLTNWGLTVLRSSIVAQLRRNEFRGVISTSGYVGAALLLDSSFESGLNVAGKERPRVAHARNNLFIGNDVGLDIRSYSTLTSDFGTTTDPGMNTFSCNEHHALPTLKGYDVMLISNREGNAILPMVGNLWDHAPVVPTSQPLDGADLYSTDSLAPDTRLATVTASPCISGALR